MPRNVPLDRSRHARLAFTASEDFGFAAGTTAVPLFGLEAVDAARAFPLVFLPGNPLPHALLGLGGKNVFLDEKKRWTASYIPLNISNYPFSLASVSVPGEEEPRLLLAVDEDAPHFRGKKGRPVYGKDGKLSGFAQRAAETLMKQLRQHDLTLAAMRELEQAGVLAAKTITVDHNGVTKGIEGLRVADREKVMALPDETLARWARNGLMDFLFAHWRSMGNLRLLLDALPAAEAEREGRPPRTL